MAFQRKLGEILVQAGVIDEFQLRSALGEQQRWGGRLGVTLIKLGFLEERDLTRALATQLDLPMVSLDGKRVQPEILERVPVELAERHMALPLFARKEAGVETLYVGMEDPCDLDALDELRFRAGMAVKPVLVGPSDLCEGIDRFYHRPARSPAPAPEPTLPSVAPEASRPADPAPAVSDSMEPALESANDRPERAADAAKSHDLELCLDEPLQAASLVKAPPKADTGASDLADAAHPGLLFRALVQLLVDKGVVGADELADRVRALQAAGTPRG